MGLPDYDELETVLSGVGSDLDAAQAHGLIGGVPWRSLPDDPCIPGIWDASCIP
jgi:hypothetical protein